MNTSHFAFDTIVAAIARAERELISGLGLEIPIGSELVVNAAGQFEERLAAGRPRPTRTPTVQRNCVRSQTSWMLGVKRLSDAITHGELRSSLYPSERRAQRRARRGVNSPRANIVTYPQQFFAELAPSLSTTKCCRVNRLLTILAGRYPMDKNEQVALRFTRRAEKLRAIASNVKDPDARQAMLCWADDYDRLAARSIELGVFGMPPTKSQVRQPNYSDQENAAVHYAV